jgi:hypothetical protein
MFKEFSYSKRLAYDPEAIQQKYDCYENTRKG